MQLNVYVPKEKGEVLKTLERVSEITKRPKNELVLEALERYLSNTPIVLGRFSMGDLDVPRRAEIYEREE